MLLNTLGNARGLYLKNHVNLDAFATVVLHGKGSLRSRAITEQVNTEGDCRWDEHCEFKLNEKSTHITVTVQHKTKFGGADVIGKCEIPLDQAKKIGGHMWFALKKKKDDDKYRGEIQLQFSFTYEKPSLSISNSSLNKIEKDGMLDKMKKKMKLGGKHKQAEDTMSVASGISGISMTSSRSSRFISKLNRSLGRKSSTLQPDRNSYVHNDTNSSFESNGHLAPPMSNGGVVFREDRSSGVSRPVSSLSGIDFNEDSSYPPHNPLSLSSPAAQGAQFTQNISGSPTASTAESFHRANSIRSVASSGFGGSNKPVKQRSDDNACSQQDLLALVDSLRLELRVKESRLRDMEEYMDNLISRVMERNPELLAAPLGPDKTKRTSRYF
ncbi:C2 domain protein [Ancylostoma ceylanicum]|uniref:C2 domain protein n=2 Tax=Ancylostoma TaxID=29169 RepID=A0A0D6LV47_9BILA|nr:C2 domain protein [Ancylostoma ceylanicum]